MEKVLRTLKTIRTAAGSAAILAACLTLPAAVCAQNSSESGCRWQTAFPGHLGIDPRSKPAEGQTVNIVEALVTDPQRLDSMGLFGVRQGDRIKMICVGSEVWRIKHYGTGLTIEFSTRPF